MTYNYLQSPTYLDKMAEEFEAAEAATVETFGHDFEVSELRGDRFLGERDFDLADLDSWTDWYRAVSGVLR